MGSIFIKQMKLSFYAGLVIFAINAVSAVQVSGSHHPDQFMA